MSTPTATPRTQALWMKHHAFSTEEEATEALCDFRDHGNTLETELAAEKSTRNHLIEKGAKLETELAAAQSERDLAITRVASILWSGAIDKHTCGDVQKWVEDYIAELTQLRAEVERLTKQNRDEESWWKEKHDYKARAERAEAALTEAIDGVIDGGSIPDTLLVIHIPRSTVGYRVGQPVKVILPAIDAAMNASGV